MAIYTGEHSYLMTTSYNVHAAVEKAVMPDLYMRNIYRNQEPLYQRRMPNNT